MITRRDFIGALAGALLAAPLAAEAQPTKTYRIGILLQTSPPPGNPPGPLRLALRDLGFIEGQNLTVDFRWAAGNNDRFPGLVGELLALRPDAIVADSTPAAIAAKRATGAIPIVIMNVSDPVGSGLVVSLAHPGGNVTGVTDFGVELAVKGVELVHAVVPNASGIAVLMSDNPVHPFQFKQIEQAAKVRRLMVMPMLVRSSADFDEAFGSMLRQLADGLVVLGGAPFSSKPQRDKLVELAAKAKLPTMYPSDVYVREGGLLGYGPAPGHRTALVAACVAKVLKGAKPADIPVEQPTRFELTVNLKTAKTLGLTIPPSLLQRADQLIE